VVQTPSWWKSCDFFDTVRHQFEKEAVYSTKQETYYRVLAKTGSSSVNCNRNSRRAAPNGGFERRSLISVGRQVFIDQSLRQN
jgi:hypothetical protein